jgi:hypothetical protein
MKKSIENSRPRKNEFFLPSFGAHLPGVPVLDNYELVFYPVPNSTPIGFDLEYTSLLLANGLVMDTASYEYINRQRTPYYADMRRTVEKLGAAGRLRLEDYGKHAKAIEPFVRKSIDQKLNEHSSWIEPVRKQWSLWKPTLKSHLEILEHYKNPQRERISYGLLCYLTSSGRVKRRDVELLTELLEARRTKLTAGESEAVREIARPYLAQAVFNQVLSQKLKIPFIDWYDLEPFHQQISIPQLAQGKFRKIRKEHLNKSRQLFEVGLNQLKPNSVDEVLQFMKNNRAVRSLRNEVQRALVDDTELDEKWANALKDDAALAEVSYRRRQQKYRWISRGMLSIPVAGPALVHTTELVWGAIDVARDVASDFLEGQAERKSLSRYEWYYALVEARGRREKND